METAAITAERLRYALAWLAVHPADLETSAKVISALEQGRSLREIRFMMTGSRHDAEALMQEEAASC